MGPTGSPQCKYNQQIQPSKCRSGHYPNLSSDLVHQMSHERLWLNWRYRQTTNCNPQHFPSPLSFHRFLDQVWISEAWQRYQKKKMPTEPMEWCASFENTTNNWHFVCKSIWASISKSPLSKSFFSDNDTQKSYVSQLVDAISPTTFQKLMSKTEVMTHFFFLTTLQVEGVPWLVLVHSGNVVPEPNLHRMRYVLLRHPLHTKATHQQKQKLKTLIEIPTAPGFQVILLVKAPHVSKHGSIWSAVNHDSMPLHQLCLNHSAGSRLTLGLEFFFNEHGHRKTRKTPWDWHILGIAKLE